MVTKLPTQKELQDGSYLTISQIEYYKKKVLTLTATLTEIKTSPYSTVRGLDPKAVWNELQNAKKMLATRTAPKDITGRNKDKLNARCKILEEQITKEMPSKDDMWGRRIKNDDGSYFREATEGAIRKHMKWQKTTEKLVREWKSIKRILCPNDPGAVDIEKLRKGKTY